MIVAILLIKGKGIKPKKFIAARHKHRSMTMEITKETDSYNERRYGKPWIAVVDYSNSRKGEFSFGDWQGRPGMAGELYITCEPGDIIAVGQKDFRKPRNSAPKYHQVNESGELIYISNNPVDAYKASKKEETKS